MSTTKPGAEKKKPPVDKVITPEQKVKNEARAK